MRPRKGVVSTLFESYRIHCRISLFIIHSPLVGLQHVIPVMVFIYSELE